MPFGFSFRLGVRDVGVSYKLVAVGLRLSRVKSQAFHEYFDLNTEFHNVYLNLSENPLLLNQLNILRQRLFDFGTKGDWVKKVQVLNYEEHLKLIELIETGKIV